MADPTVSATQIENRPTFQLVLTNDDVEDHTLTVTRTKYVGKMGTVRWANSVLVAAGQSLTLIDDEPPIGRSFRYTLYSDGVVVDNDGPYTVDAPWSVDGAPSWAWLKHLSTPTLSVPIVISSMPELTREGRSGVFVPIGASLPVVTSFPRGGRAGELVILTMGEQSAQAVNALVDDGTALQFVADPGFGVDRNGMYVAVTDFSEERLVDSGTDHARLFHLQLVEVNAPPPIGGQGVLHTYNELFDYYGNYGAIRDLGLTASWTYVDLLTKVHL